ncbi:MAG: AAA family ATPase [Candidatus Methanomethylophilaceae archaeon]|nr:AAA family ATPase [Candidatus Methanomethylophilaceae archaeon]
MKGFVGRVRELEYLETIWSKERYKTCAIFGRRRIGKTSLINQFIQDKDSIVFDMVKGSERENVLRMMRILGESLSTDSDASLFDVFQVLKRICSERDTVIVIDEMPYLTGRNPGAASEIQHFVDWMVDNSGSMMIVCGSSVSMMLEELNDRKDPLYGRFHHRVDLGPLTIEETRQFHPGLSDQDILRTYLILGGIPLFHAGAGDRSYRAIVEDYLLDPNGIFNNDSVEIVVSELKSLSSDAMSVLEAVSSGHSRFGEIVSRTGLPDPVVNKCLTGLSGMRLIDTLHPMAGAPKHPRYIITDGPTSFHFSVIRNNPNSVRVTEGRYDALSQQITTFLGKQFEIFCRDEISIRYPCVEIGSWWGAVPVRDEEGNPIHDDRGKVVTEDEDIDVVATLRSGNNRIDMFAECKFTKNKVSFTTLNKLQRRVSSLKGGYNARLAIVSGSGFEDDLIEYAEDAGVILIGPENIVGKEPYPQIIRGRLRDRM